MSRRSTDDVAGGGRLFDGVALDELVRLASFESEQAEPTASALHAGLQKHRTAWLRFFSGMVGDYELHAYVCCRVDPALIGGRNGRAAEDLYAECASGEGFAWFMQLRDLTGDLVPDLFRYRTMRELAAGRTYPIKLRHVVRPWQKADRGDELPEWYRERERVAA